MSPKADVLKACFLARMLMGGGIILRSWGCWVAEGVPFKGDVGTLGPFLPPLLPGGYAVNEPLPHPPLSGTVPP